MLLDAGHAKVARQAPDGDDERVVGEGAGGRHLPTLVIEKGRDLDQPLRAVDASQLADTVAEPVPVRLRQIIELVQAEVHAAGGDFVQQRLPQVGARLIDERDRRLPSPAELVAEPRCKLQSARTAADYDDLVQAGGRVQGRDHKFLRLALRGSRRGHCHGEPPSSSVPAAAKSKRLAATVKCSWVQIARERRHWRSYQISKRIGGRMKTPRERNRKKGRLRSDGGLVLVARAADFAARAHASQKRKGVAQEPYVNHLAEVALLLTEATGGSDPALIAAAWLHDTLEDTITEREELETLFGKEVASIVAEVTDDKSLPKSERKRLQIETTPGRSRAARLLKIADKTSNLRALASSPPMGWDIKRREEYVTWAEAVVAGCRGLNADLEAKFNAAAADARAALTR